MSLPSHMKAAVWYGPNDVRVETRPVPAVIPGSVLVEVMACAVCGSDLRIFREGNPRITVPRIIGHEIAGVVAEVGSGVTRFKTGDRVSIGADIPCGKCVHCLSGRANCCDTNLAIGYQFDGGYADYVRLDPIVVELGPVHLFSQDVTYDAAALAEPLACCLNGYERALFRPGNTVAIFGAGPIGLMLAMLGQYSGAGGVIVVEPSTYRRRKAEEAGASLVIDPRSEDPVARILEFTHGNGADTIFTACPVAETHEQAVQVVAKRGVINFFGGLPKAAPPIRILSNLIHYREAYITGSHGSTPAQHQQALEIISSGQIDAARMISHGIDLADVVKGFNLAGSGETMKVVVHPNKRT